MGPYMDPESPKADPRMQLGANDVDEILYLADSDSPEHRDARPRWRLGAYASALMCASALGGWLALGESGEQTGATGLHRMEASRFYAAGHKETAGLNGSGGLELPVPPVPTCRSLVCPKGYVQRPKAEDKPCASSEGGFCTKADLPTCCWQMDALCRDGRAIDFGASSLLHNNLDGAGPGGGEPGLTLYNVLTHGDSAVDTNESSPVVNLEMFSSGDYVAEHEFVAKNGLDTQRRLVQVAVRQGTTLDLIGRFVKHPSWRLSVLEPYYLTVLDLQGVSLGIGGFESYYLGDSTEVKVEVGSDGLVWFSAPARKRGGPLDEPMEPLLLTESQRRRSVTLRMPAGSHFALTLHVATTGFPEDGRLLLTGAASLTCPPPLKYINSVTYRETDRSVVDANVTTVEVFPNEAERASASAEISLPRSSALVTVHH